MINLFLEGFLPEKKPTNDTWTTEETRTIILYVSPHKLVKTLAEFITYFGEDRQICVSRELSKLHEEGTVFKKFHFEKKPS
jgi:16S rRNA (cytidine1402-2'-O)-methyltransferase